MHHMIPETANIPIRWDESEFKMLPNSSKLESGMYTYFECSIDTEKQYMFYTEEQLKELKEECQKGLPIVLDNAKGGSQYITIGKTVNAFVENYILNIQGVVLHDLQFTYNAITDLMHNDFRDVFNTCILLCQLREPVCTICSKSYRDPECMHIYGQKYEVGSKLVMCNLIVKQLKTQAIIFKVWS